MFFTFFRKTSFSKILLALPLLGEGLNLDAILSGESITKTYEISLPDYPNAYNPSILPYEDGYLLSFRYNCGLPHWPYETPFSSRASFIGLALLDREFRIKKKSVQLLEIQTYDKTFSLFAEDARLFSFQNRIFVLCNDYPIPSGEYLRRLYLGEITYEKNRWVVKKRAVPLLLDNPSPIEKNWTPFCVNGSLYLIYGEEPHTILLCDPNTGYSKKVDERFVDLHWDYGVIRGGTPALEVDGQFLTFFHSSLETSELYDRRVYFMGAYCFDTHFPFTIRHYTENPIGLSDYYKETSRSKEHAKKVVFPGGFVREGNKIHLAWGKDDKMIVISTIDLQKLLESMTSL